MTRRELNNLAWALRIAHPRQRGEYAPETDAFYYNEQGWTQVYSEVARVCAESNPRFSESRFAQAAGYELRPDGSLYPMLPPR